MQKWTEDKFSRSNSILKIQNDKDKVKNAKKNIEEARNERLKKRDDIFWRYSRNKRLNKLFRELEKENPKLPILFQIKQREHEVDVKFENNLVKNPLKQS